ncbi:MAG: TrkA family potassium uptake protein [Bacilli bacterium]|nr:TrkA family potassium uptake protein [Bacilli bacterium]
MNIVIANGDHEASYIIDMFKSKENNLIVINSSEEIAMTLMERKHVAVTVGDPWLNSTLEAADIFEADLFVSLCKKDTDNFAACMTAKKIFKVKKCICVVQNPRNVDLYKKIGIDSVISSTYLLAANIKNESNADSLIKSLSLDDEKIVMIEAILSSKYIVCGHAIKDIGFPKFASIAYIVRNYNFLIPHGDVELREGDMLMIACAKENEKKVLDYLKREKRA